MKQRITILLFLLLYKFSAFAQVPSYIPTNGLVGWWPFNGNVYDESYNGNNGVINGQINYVPDRFGIPSKSVFFQPSSVINTVNLQPANCQFTLSLWLKIPIGYISGGGAIRFVNSPSGFSSQCDKMIQVLSPVNNVALFVYPGYQIYLSSAASISDNQWHHVVASTSLTGMYLFLDGVLVATNPNTNCENFAGYWRMELLDATLDDIGIWNRALSPSEIQQLFTSQAPCTLTNNFFATDSISACGNSVTLDAQNAGATYSWSTNATTQTINANTSGWYKCAVSQGATCSVTDSIYVSLPNALPASLQTGLVGYWPFCGNANDESGNGNNGTVNGATLTSDRYGKSNGAYKFSKSQNSFIKTNFNVNQNPNTFSYSFWIKPDSSIILPIEGTVGGIVGVVSSQIVIHPNHGSVYGVPTTNSGTGICIGTNGIVVLEHSNNFVKASLVCEININGWHNIVLSYINKIPFVYLDGVLIKVGLADVRDVHASNGFDNNTYGDYSNSGFGAGFNGPNNNGYFYSGLLDDICIWNRALSSSEIQQLYTSQSANLASNNTSTNNANPSNLPNGISYQAIARDSLGQPLANTNVEVRFTIRDSSVTGAVVYKETHTLTTNQFGLFTTAIGSGNAQSGVYANINWMGAAKFLDVELKQGSNYILLGCQQLLAVPYANASSVSGEIRNNQLPVYNDNAAAISGGLLPGKMYRTPSGVLMIVY